MIMVETEDIKKGFGFALAIVSCIVGILVANGYALDPPAITPVDEFFVENMNGIPTVPDDWRLTVDGAIATPLTLTLNDLMNYPAVTQMATLECMGNPFTPRLLVGNANWTGVPLRTILQAANPLGVAQSIIFHCLDGYRVHFGLAEVLQRDNDILAYCMNGEALPLEQGYPLRLVLPGTIGTVWAQWVERIEVSTTAPENTFVPIPLHAQIFNPTDGDTLGVGTHTISGMAIVGEGREITRVEISTNGGITWRPTHLLHDFVPDVWRHWACTWEVDQEGDYEILARAEDDAGNQQGDDGFFNILSFSIGIAVDSDGDGDHVPDSADNCPNDYNPGQEDDDGDGTGDACELTTTTTALSDSCLIDELYGDDSDHAELLRYFRDTVLSQTMGGRDMIKLYYAWSPFLVKTMQADEKWKAWVKDMLDVILPLIEEWIVPLLSITTEKSPATMMKTEQRADFISKAQDLQTTW